MNTHESQELTLRIDERSSVARDRLFEAVRERWSALAHSCCQNSELVSKWSSQSTALVLAELDTSNTRAILDMACGAGDPTLQLAVACPSARVVGADFVAAFAAELKQRSSQLGLSNVEAVVANMAALPFAEAEFDAVTCRFGLQTYPEETKLRILAEVLHVLRPGGRLVVVDWGPGGHGAIHGFYADILAEYARGSERNPNAVAPSSDEELASSLRSVGFRSVEHCTRPVHWSWQGSPESLWDFVLEMVPAVRPVFERLAAPEARAARERIIRALSPYVRGGSVELPARNVVVTGLKHSLALRESK